MSSPMFFATSLKYYKQPHVQEAILRHAQDREVSVRYLEAFGRRPDTIAYPGDILSFATRKASSFHCSEERWQDPLALGPTLTRKQLDDLRIGWDLLLDIDCPHWSFSKLTTTLFIEALKAHNIESITCKFSGSKGFHIGVPFEAFPKEYNDQPTKDLFPEAPRAIAEYLLAYMSDPNNNLIHVSDTTVMFLPQTKKLVYTLDQLKELTLPGKDLLKTVCSSCHKDWQQKTRDKYCPSCQEPTKEGALKCDSCGYILEQVTTRQECKHCSSTQGPVQQIDFSAIIEVDTILLASRHLFRMPYSLHEKTSLVSAPIKLDEVLAFEKEQAAREVVDYEQEFLGRNAKPSEAADLLGRAMSRQASQEQEQLQQRKNYDVPEEAIPEELFPPCMKNILSGLKDGKKRALFILTNFLRTAGWSDEMIKDRVYDWNEINPEPLREVIIKGHLQLKEKKKEAVPPPNCTSDYYTGLAICTPDDFCRTIKNPAQYANKKYRLKNPKKQARTKLTKEQKAMRKKYRERQKEQEQDDEDNQNQE